MNVVIPAKYVEAIAGSKDPKKAIQDMVGNLDGVEVFGDMVLIGTYIRPNKNSGGVWRPETNVQEDVWQGKVGLVLKRGPDAFIYPEDGEPYEQSVKEGDWCVFRVGDGWSLNINGAACRLVRDTNIRMKLQNPEAVF
jgi:hypothetical protein